MASADRKQRDEGRLRSLVQLKGVHVMLRHTVFVFLIVVSSSSIALAQTVLHVRADAAAGGDGSSWASAFDDLQDALDAAGP